jgi:hypothetical protein
MVRRRLIVLLCDCERTLLVRRENAPSRESPQGVPHLYVYLAATLALVKRECRMQTLPRISLVLGRVEYPGFPHKAVIHPCPPLSYLCIHSTC